MAWKDHWPFWTAIRAAPKDDAPRLEYADWLEEHGDPNRAELIHVQCSLAILGPDRRKGRKERLRLEPREQELLADHGDRWLAPYRTALAGSNTWDRDDGWLQRLKLVRGFPDCSHLGLESARRLAAAGNDIGPVNSVQVMECGARYCHKSVAEIVSWPGAGCLIQLSLAWGGDRDIAAIVTSAHVRNLDYLSIWNGNVTDEGVHEIAAWPFAAALRSLSFKECPITDRGAFALADSPLLGLLRYLDLTQTRIGSAGQNRLRDRFGDIVKL